MNRDPSSVEEAVEDFLERRRRGERVEAREYAARHAHLGSDVYYALDTLDELERAAPDVADEPYDVPDRVGPYRVVREVGRGGMGVVLEAIEEPLGRRVALKVLPPHYLANSAARARFRREAELASRLDHPGIATVYGTGGEDDRPWIAMRFVEGETLAHAITRSRAEGRACVRLRATHGSEDEAALAVAEFIESIARALQAAHAEGVVHRDVKPSNVIVTPEGTPVLVDFGLAIPEESSDQSLTHTGETAGTPAYIAPEIIAGERRRSDAQSDVYALGVTLYECLTLRRPFDEATPAALYRAILAGEPRDVRSSNRRVPRDLAVVVATAMERDRDRRYANAAALAADLAACAEFRPIAARPLPLHGRVFRWAQREPRQALLTGLLAASVIGLALFGGSWWTARDEVRAASRVARARALDAAIEQGFEYLDLGRSVEAEDAFTRALAIEPENFEALVGHVMTSTAKGDGREARARLDALPKEIRARTALEALVDGRPLVGNTLDALPPDTDATELCIRGLCWQADAARRPFQERQPMAERALALFSEAITRSPTARLLYHVHRAGAAQRTGDAKASRSASAALTKLWPDSARALYAAGYTLVQIDPRAARPLLERSIALDPTRVDPYNLVAQACQNSGDSTAAEDWVRRGLELHPRAAALLYLLADAVGTQGCVDEARAAYVAAAKVDPSLAAAWIQLGAYAFVDGEDELAIGYYRRALDLDAQNHRARIFFAALLLRAGRSDEGREQLDHSIAAIYPADIGYWRALSGFFAHIHAFEGALGVTTVGLELEPDDEELQRVQAEAIAELDR